MWSARQIHSFLPGPISLTISELCAVVTVTDDGGSSGRLRKELNMLPPGDVRNCIVASVGRRSSSLESFSASIRKRHRPRRPQLRQSVSGRPDIVTGDFSEAVRLSSEILATRGHIYPATAANIELEALMDDGSRVCGETKITASKGRVEELFLVPRHPSRFRKHSMQSLAPI